MSLINADIVDAFIGMPLSERVLVGYEERRIYLPDTCLVWIGHVVSLERRDESLQRPLQVHTEYAPLVNVLGEEIDESLMTDTDFEDIATFTFFILTEGVGIKVENSRPFVIPHETEDGTIVSLSVFHTKEGVVPHKLVAPSDHNIDISMTLLDIVSTKVRELDFVYDVKPFLLQKDDERCVYMFEVPRVIPKD